MNEFDGADIDTAGRLADDEQVGIAIDLTPQDDLLLIAPRKESEPKIGVLWSYVKGFHVARRVHDDGAPVEEWSALIFLVVLIAENEVVAGIEGCDDAEAMAVFGHMGEPALTRLCRVASKRFAVEQDLSAYRLSDAGDCLEQLALAVAHDTGDADDLARSDTERHIVDTD